MLDRILSAIGVKKASPATAGATPAQARPAPVRRKPASEARSASGAKRAERSQLKVIRDYPLIEPEIKRAGALLTAPGSKLDGGDELRQLVAVFANGLFLVNVDQQGDPRIQSLHTKASRAHNLTLRRCYVSPVIISTIYEQWEKRRASGEDEVDISGVREKFLRIVTQAHELGASDIHIQVTRSGTYIDLTQHGVLHRKAFDGMTESEGRKLIAAAYEMGARGTTSGAFNETGIHEWSISSEEHPLPRGLDSLRMESAGLVGKGLLLVARLLPEAQDLDVEKLDLTTRGYDPVQARQIDDMLIATEGIIIFAGPTGSGKSTSQHHCMRRMHHMYHGQRNILTIEDPVEYRLPEARQMSVQRREVGGRLESKEEAFSRYLSASLRMAPHVILLGEIRGKDTAELAVQAAQTGHLVFSTLHANHAFGIFQRLETIGLSGGHIYDETTFVGFVAQRLIRTVCPNCSLPMHKADADPDLITRVKAVTTDLDRIRFPNREGCDRCFHGFIGREVVAEVVRPDAELMELMRRAGRREAQAYWKEHLGGMTMMDHAIKKMIAGVVSPCEVERMLGRKLPTGIIGQINNDEDF